MPSLPLTLVARLLPTTVLAIAGWAMTTGTPPDAHSGPSGAQPSSAHSVATARYAKPPAPCTAIPAGTVKELVPGVEAAGNELETSDPAHRTGCSWHALQGFDYRWLDVTFELPAAVSESGGQTAEQAARAEYAQHRQGTAVPGLGDDASVGSELTENGGQQTVKAVVVARKANAVVTVTYTGSDFETGKAPSADTVRKGALSAAEEAVNALDSRSS